MPCFTALEQNSLPNGRVSFTRLRRNTLFSFLFPCLTDFPLLVKTIFGRPDLVFGIIAALALGKFIAAWVSVQMIKGSSAEVGLAWSVSLPQMAATLASAVVAHQTVNAAGVPLLDEIYVNTVLVLVIATCSAEPILSKRYASQVLGRKKDEALAEQKPKTPGASW